MSCIRRLYNSYVKAKNQISKSKFYSNKVDTIKLTFDSKFNDLNEETFIKSEISRQIDKSINNAIGTFHEEILGGIDGYEKGNLDGYDIKASDNTLFADIKNKHNTMNSGATESLYQKLSKFAENYPNSECYWVQIWATKSFNVHWSGKINGKQYNHERVNKISGDQFYKLLSKHDTALKDLYDVLPRAINDFLETLEDEEEVEESSAFEEISQSAQKNNRSIINQITFDNFNYYLGFDK